MYVYNITNSFFIIFIAQKLPFYDVRNIYHKGVMFVALLYASEIKGK